MLTPNTHYAELKDSYLFYNISQRLAAYSAAHPGKKLYRMGIGDVTLPLCPAVISALHRAVDDQARCQTFHGYMPEQGAEFLREAIAAHYRSRGVSVGADEVFVSSGASDELGDILDLFDRSSAALVRIDTSPEAEYSSSRRSRQPITDRSPEPVAIRPRSCPAAAEPGHQG